MTDCFRLPLRMLQRAACQREPTKNKDERRAWTISRRVMPLSFGRTPLHVATQPHGDCSDPWALFHV